MNIQTVAANLRNTIAGKEMLLETYKNPSVLTKPIRETMAHMLEINIDELKRILEDVEHCEEFNSHEESQEGKVTITAEAVKHLRDRTDAPMMECKKALTACNGDMTKAMDWIATKPRGLYL